MRGLADVIDELAPRPASREGLRVQVLTVELPLEVAVRRGAGGELAVLASAPSQPFRTSWMPVIHRARVTLEVESEA